MNFNLLFDNFDLLLNSPEQIPKLNQAILQLAVQGRLVPQDPTDKPVTELLKQIKAEKEKLILEKKIVKEKSNSLILSNEILYELPESWKWYRLEDLFYPVSTRGKQLETKDYNKDGRFPIIGQGKEYITGYSDLEENVIKVDNPVIVFGDHTREIKYVDFDFIAGADGIKILNPFKPIYEKYFYYVLKSYIIESRGYARHYNRLIKKLFPLPPLNEQKRIVAKIENLLSKTQEIEIQLKQADQEIVNLNKAVQGGFLDTRDAYEFQERWQFILDNFDLLYSDERNIGDLKQAILQLAVQGKLIPQDPADEPATNLLKRIKAEKLQLMREKKIKKEKPLPLISSEEIPYELPEGWVWVRLGELLPQFQNGISKRDSSSGQAAIVLRLADIINGEISLSSSREIKLTQDEIDRYELRKDDMLITRVNGSIDLVGSFILVRTDDQLSYCDHFIRMRMDHSIIYMPYLVYVGRSELIRNQIREKFITTAGQKTVNQHHISTLIFPLPPLNEQKRIVAKVDELMRLCDELEEQIRQSKEESERLMQAVLREAFEGKDVEESDHQVSVA